MSSKSATLASMIVRAASIAPILRMRTSRSVVVLQRADRRARLDDGVGAAAIQVLDQIEARLYLADQFLRQLVASGLGLGQQLRGLLLQSLKLDMELGIGVHLVRQLLEVVDHLLDIGFRAIEIGALAPDVLDDAGIGGRPLLQRFAELDDFRVQRLQFFVGGAVLRMSGE